MKKVHWLSNETPDLHGQGGQRRQYFQIRELVRAGHEVRVVSLAGEQDDSSIRALAGDVYRVPPLMVKGRLPIPWRWQRLRRRLAGWGDVLVVSHGETWEKFAPVLPEDTSMVVDMHNVFSRWPFADGTVDTEHWRKVERQIRASADVVTVVSDREAAAMPPGRAPLLTVENGIDPAQWEIEPAPADSPVLKLFGNWDWAPNTAGLQWFATHVWPQVHEVTGAECHIAGTGVSQQIRGVRGLVAVGRVPDMQEYLSNAWVVALPLPETIGAPVKYPEGLAVGVPLVTTHQVAYNHHDMALVTDDAQDWIALLSDLLGGDARPRPLDPAQRRDRLQKLSWTATTAPLLQWIDQR